jgi:hypothetical protein
VTPFPCDERAQIALEILDVVVYGFDVLAKAHGVGRGVRALLALVTPAKIKEFVVRFCVRFAWIVMGVR